MEPIIDHIQITVRDLSIAEPFYDELLPLLGFDLERKVGAVIDEHEFQVVEYGHPRFAFAITSPRSAFADEAVHRRRPGALHHLAFRVATRAEVDRLHLELRRIGADIVSPPREYPEYQPPGYYAVFFKDPDGIKYTRSSRPNGTSRLGTLQRIEEGRDERCGGRRSPTAEREPAVRDPMPAPDPRFRRRGRHRAGHAGTGRLLLPVRGGCRIPRA